MPEFTVNPNRHDPYKNFKFRVEWDGKTVSGVSHMSCLFWTAQVVEHREGGENSSVHRGPGAITYEPITLSRGVTHDTAFEDWASSVVPTGAGGGLIELRKTVTITLLNEKGHAEKAYKLYRCWPSRYQPFCLVEHGEKWIAVESITLQYEGFERDKTVG